MSHKHKHHRKNRDIPHKVSLEDIEAMYTSQDPPVTPINGFVKPTKKSNGYNFYLRVRENLPEWWESFNGSLDNLGNLKYITIRKFIEKKVSKGEERKLLHQMIGPLKQRPEECSVPWLGDWERRRKNGFGVLDNGEQIRPLLKAIKSNIAAAESIKSLTPLLVEELVQYSALQKQIHQAFAGKAFLSTKSADDKHNRSRFEAYKTMLWSLSELKIKLIDQIMRCHGVDPNNPQQMREMAQIAGGIGAAAALTGIAAGQNVPGLRGYGALSIDGKTIAPYTYDSIKLAEQLTRHAHTFKKPLPVDIEGEVVEKDSSDSSSSKSNGKPQ